MDNANSRLKHALMMKFNMAYTEPSDAALESIKAELLQILKTGKELTRSDWERVVNRYRVDNQIYKRAGLDNSDLNTLLALAIKVTGE